MDDSNVASSTENEIDSEMDIFEKYIDEYEKKKNQESDEEIFKDSSECGFEVTHSPEDLEFSFTSSFFKNTFEKNDDFLEDKFNGNNLVDRFSEEKFIHCKYSEELHLNDFKSKNKFILESENDVVNSEDNVNNDEIVNSSENLIKIIKEEHQEIKLQRIEEEEQVESETEEIIELRKKHFLDFISTIPKVCTPSICGTMKKSKLEQKKSEETLNEEENLLSEENNDFDWSIDQLAVLKPVEISFDEDKFLRFKDFELDEETQEKLSRENEKFFSQEKIAPSPKAGFVEQVDTSLAHNDLSKQLTPQCETPLNTRKNSFKRNKSLFKNYFDRSEECSNLEFSPKSINQTSTPCRPIKKLLFKDL